MDFCGKSTPRWEGRELAERPERARALRRRQDRRRALQAVRARELDIFPGSPRTSCRRRWRWWGSRRPAARPRGDDAFAEVVAAPRCAPSGERLEHLRELLNAEALGVGSRRCPSTGSPILSFIESWPERPPRRASSGHRAVASFAITSGARVREPRAVSLRGRVLCVRGKRGVCFIPSRGVCQSRVFLMCFSSLVGLAGTRPLTATEVAHWTGLGPIEFHRNFRFRGFVCSFDRSDVHRSVNITLSVTRRRSSTLFARSPAPPPLAPRQGCWSGTPW